MLATQCVYSFSNYQDIFEMHIFLHGDLYICAYISVRKISKTQVNHVVVFNRNQIVKEKNKRNQIVSEKTLLITFHIV
jgi:uncharacterized membrane protein